MTALAPTAADGAKARVAGAPETSILRLSAPLVVSFMMRALFTFVDTYFAAVTVGDAGVAAIGLAFPYEFLMIAVWVGLSTGLTSTLARAMGAREGVSIDRLLRASGRMSFWLCPAFAAIGAAIWLTAPLHAKDPATARAFQIFGTVLVGGSAFSMFWSVNPDSVVKAHHDTRATMWAGIWSNVINAGLNIVFTFVFGWGMFGIAFSTVLGRFGGLVYAIRKANGHERRRKREGLWDAPPTVSRPYRAILTLGVPAGLGYVLMAAESAVINGILRGLPDATSALATYSIYFRVLMFVVMPAIATSVAMLPFAARLYGAGNIVAMRRGLREAMLAGVAYSALIAAPVFALFAPRIASFLSKSPVTIHQTTVALYFVPLGSLIALPFFLCRPMFEGMQMARPGFVVALLRYLVLTGPFAWLGVHAALRLHFSGLFGLLGGVLLATAVASATLLLWLLVTLRRLPHGSARATLPNAPSHASQATERSRVDR